MKTLQQKIISLIISSEGIKPLDLAKALNVPCQSIYSAITILRRKSVKVYLKNDKYYIEKNVEQNKCDNLFCLHNVANKENKLSEWNDTNCGMYEIDPFYEENKDGFRIQECFSKLQKIWLVA